MVGNWLAVVHEWSIIGIILRTLPYQPALPWPESGLIGFARSFAQSACAVSVLRAR